MRPPHFAALALVVWLAACGDDRGGDPAAAPPGPPVPASDAGSPDSEAGAASDDLCAPVPLVMDHPGTPDCPIPLPAAKDAFDDALAVAGTSRCALNYSATDPYNKNPDPHRLPWFDEVHDHALRAPGFARRLVSRLDESAASDRPVAGALQVAAFAVGESSRPCVAPFAIDAARPLAHAVETIITNAGGAANAAALDADAADVPMDLQHELAQVLLAAEEAHNAWEMLTAKLSASDLHELGKAHGILFPTVTGTPNVKDKAVETVFSTFDVKGLVRGGVSLALRIERAKLPRFAGLRGFSFDQGTPLGRILIHDAADHTYADDPKHVLLVVDTGGNDTYLFPAGAVDAWHEGNEAFHVGLAIDLAGNDTYGYASVPTPNDGKRLPSDSYGRSAPASSPEQGNGPLSISETLRQGAGRLGYGMLFDFGTGNDTYRSLLLSQGYSDAGIGVLYDEGGDDQYLAEGAAQGASHLGVGLLLDRAGNDTYKGYCEVQGFGGIRSVGILYDAAGSDHYVADNGDPADGGDPLYWTIQIPGKGNNSFSQGAAFGLRSSGSAWPNMSGGLGVLRDRMGDDIYEASVQAQASGYWYGTGILADGAGDDAYDARYYVQGAGAHFGLAVFLEDGGNDRYNQRYTPKATSIGVGHDRTVAWHVDLGGNDVYRAPGLSLGSGNANGTSFFLNIGGDDTYKTATDLSLGAATLSKEWFDACPSCARTPTTGIFLDIGGTDVYDGPFVPAKVNGTTWSSPRAPTEWNAIENSAGVDANTGTVTLP